MTKKARKREKRKKIKKTIRKLFVYSIIGTIITGLPLFYINNYVLSDDYEPVSINKSNKKYTYAAERIKVDMPYEAKDIGLTYDGKYISYIEHEKLYLKEVSEDGQVKEIESEEPVIYAKPFDDRDMIMYFTYNNDMLHINTYDIKKDEIREHKSIEVRNLIGVKDVKYSSLTNLIYINVEIDNGEKSLNRIYRIDIMKNVSIYVRGKRVENMALLSREDTLIYQDDKNNIYIEKRLFKNFSDRKLSLLGVDKDEAIYLMSVKDPMKVYVIKDRIVNDEKQIEDMNYTSIINKNNTIYLIYNNYILDFAQNKKIDIEEGSSVIDIVDNHILYKNGRGETIVRQL
jgi:hypothetical protein